MNSHIIRLCILALASINAISAYGWGQKGHDATCAIAERHLFKASCCLSVSHDDHIADFVSKVRVFWLRTDVVSHVIVFWLRALHPYCNLPGTNLKTHKK